MDVTVIGYGSLMSGQGLSLSGTFQVRQAFVVALANCTRGFARLSRYGDRFAMNLEITRLPLEGRVVSLASTPNGAVEALALTMPPDHLCRLAKRAQSWAPRTCGTDAPRRTRSPTSTTVCWAAWTVSASASCCARPMEIPPWPWHWRAGSAKRSVTRGSVSSLPSGSPERVTGATLV